MISQYLAIYGGSFDPVHNGHVTLVAELLHAFPFLNLHILPAAQSPLKPPCEASFTARVTMLQLAFKHLPQVIIDTREANRTPAYTVHTLEQFRQEFSNASVNLVLGMDAYHHFDAWHHYERILTLANLLVVPRQGYEQPITGKCAQLLEKHQVFSRAAWCEKAAGAIFLTDFILPKIAASTLRQQLKKGSNVASFLPEAVYNYIVDSGIYIN